MRIRGAVVIVALLGSTSSRAATDLESFEAKVRRVAADFGKAPKGLCVCLSGAQSVNDIGGVGILRRATDGPVGAFRVRARCFVPTFDSQGTSGGQGAECDGWVPLAK